MNEFHWGRRFKNTAFDFFAALKTERVEKEIYLLAGETLVKIKLAAEKNEVHGTATISCAVSEIDGEPVDPETQKERAAETRPRPDQPPTAEEQFSLISAALGKWNIFDRPAKVSEGYVEGHLKAVRMKKRIKQGGNVDVYS